MYYKDRATEKREIMNLNKCIPRYLYQAVGAGQHVGAVSTKRRVAGEILAVDHPELSNQLPAALPYSTYMEQIYN